MITRISVEDRNLNSTYAKSPVKKVDNTSPSFKGGPWAALLWGIQECEKNPMVNVAVVDMFSAILPRTFVESLTNWFAGFEAFRRESSGLIVNCLIPSIVAWGAAAGLSKFVMPKNTGMASCWADSSLLQRATEIYNKSTSADKIKDSLKDILSNTEGWHGTKKVYFKEELGADIEKYADELAKLTKSDDKTKFKDAMKRISKEISDKTHVFENVTVSGEGTSVKASTVKTLLEDSVKYYKGYNRYEADCVEKGIKCSIENFAKKSKKLVAAKSVLGLAIILPLAASMQYINRWITEKASGVKGAPIYDDYGTEQNEAIRVKSKEGLFEQKIISIASMVGVSLLSMMKKPTWNMFEFKGWFPTMDQARIISTTTFASRMAAADDKNELAEATVRDIATFAGLYFLGDYAGKATATAIENKTGIKLLNDTKPLEKDANIFKRFWHWVKDVNIKSSEEVVSKTAEALKEKGLQPNDAQKKTIEKELKYAVNLRSACQVANLGVSLVLLGLIIPIFTRNNTKKKHAEALRIAQESQNDKGINSNNN